MNWKEANKLKPGAIIRRSWETGTFGDKKPQLGLVLAKKHEKGKKRESQICQFKDERYILTVSWFKGPTKYSIPQSTITQLSSWEVMVVSHTS